MQYRKWVVYIRCRMKFVTLLLSAMIFCVLASGNNSENTVFCTKISKLYVSKNLTGKLLGGVRNSEQRR